MQSAQRPQGQPQQRAQPQPPQIAEQQFDDDQLEIPAFLRRQAN
jgi:cell division protein FtsZ